MTPPPDPGRGKSAGSIPSTSTSLAIPIIVALFVILLTVVFLWRRKARRGRSVLLVGPCDAGKTALFSKIVGGETVRTVTSVMPNELDFLPSGGKAPLSVKDLPGHDRVQIKFWDDHKSSARGIVCVVDAAAGSKGIREAADVLYRVLTDPSVVSGRPSVLVFANKQDQPMSKAVKVIRNQLEKELTTLRMTKSAGLASTGGKEASHGMLGRPDKDFEFEQLSRMQITFGEGSALGTVEEVKVVTEWMETLA